MILTIKFLLKNIEVQSIKIEKLLPYFYLISYTIFLFKKYFNNSYPQVSFLDLVFHKKFTFLSISKSLPQDKSFPNATRRSAARKLQPWARQQYAKFPHMNLRPKSRAKICLRRGNVDSDVTLHGACLLMIHNLVHSLNMWGY